MISLKYVSKIDYLIDTLKPYGQRSDIYSPIEVSFSPRLQEELSDVQITFNLNQNDKLVVVLGLDEATYLNELLNVGLNMKENGSKV